MQRIGNFVFSLRNKLWYAVLMGLLALISATMIGYEFFVPHARKDVIQIMTDIDLGIAYIFLVDFLLGVFVAHHKVQHLKENWLDLLGSIPLSDSVFRAMRILRFVRFVRVLRAANAGLNIQESIEMWRRNSRRKK